MTPAEGLGRHETGMTRRTVEVPRLSDHAVRDLADQVERTGFAVVPNYLAQDTLEELQALSRQCVSQAGGEYVARTGREDVAGTLLSALPEQPDFTSLLQRLYQRATGRPAPRQAVYQVLRCLTGRTARKECFIFHYDSYVVTLLLPILIPTEGLSGHLVLWPNLRAVRPTYMLNLLDKLLVDNKLSQFILKRLFLIGWLKLCRIEMVPGNLYIFWGYRTLHTNEPCDPQNIRATALFHFGDPHGDSPLRRRMGRVAT